MYFDKKAKVLLLLSGDRFQSWLSSFIGVNRREKTFGQVFASIEDEALTGNTTGIVPEVYWTARSGVVYMSNGDGHQARIEPGKVEIVDNGTDGVLFAAGATLAPWQLTGPVDPFTGCSLWRDMKTASGHGLDLLRVWAMALPLNLACKPPMVLSGTIGSGKTQAVRGLFTLYGIAERVVKVLETGESDFWTVQDGGGLAVYDNADTRVKWLADALAAAATAGSHCKRRLYTDGTAPGETVQQQARAWTALTTANPTFAADAGLADRLLVIRMNRRDAGETAETSLHDQIRANRDAGLSFIARTLATALADSAPVPAGLNRRHPDFAGWAVKIGRALGREAEVVQAVRAAESDKALFCIEQDDIGQALLSLMTRSDSWTGTGRELHAALIAADEGFNADHFQPKRLAKRLAKLWPHLEGIFRAKQYPGHQSYVTYSFTRPGDFGDFQEGVSGKVPTRERIEGFMGNSPSKVAKVAQNDPPEHEPYRDLPPAQDIDEEVF